jgi:hypothetical protein
MEEITMYDERVIAFIDILGFKEMVDTTHATQSINEILIFPRDYFDTKKKENPEIYKDIQIITVSDSIIISFKYDCDHAIYTLMLDLLNIIIGWIKKDVLCRGAIVKGDMHHCGNLLYGPGFNKAVELEKKASYPRIILEKDIYNIGVKYHDKKGTEGSESAFINTLFMDDVDFYYIDYFSTPVACVRNVDKVKPLEYLNQLKTIIIKGMNNKDNNIKNKYCWMLKKFKSVINRIESLADKSPRAFDMVYKDITKNEFTELKTDLLKNIARSISLL